MRLHVLGLPWTETNAAFTTCAYTQKLVKFGRMMTEAGHKVFLYSGEENEAACSEHVPLFSRQERVGWFDEHNPNSVWGHITWDPADAPWQVVNGRAIAEIALRAEPFDIICSVAGWSQKSVLDAFPKLIGCEPFVGYEGIAANFCAFESHVWRHHVYGLKGIKDGRWYDDVIPNYFDLADFKFQRQPDDYLLYVGRVTARKNPQVAAQIAEALGMRLVVVGPGVQSVEPGRIVGDGCVLEGEGLEYAGVMGIKERKSVLGGAKALIAPTAFLEPFGGVAVEAMLSGTPAVTSNWGAFTETVKEGVSGYRFRTLAEGVEATVKAFDLNRSSVRSYARAEYSLKAVAPRFERWFDQLNGLWNGGWGSLPGKET